MKQSIALIPFLLIGCIQPAVMAPPAADKAPEDSLRDRPVTQIESFDPLLLPRDEELFQPEWSSSEESSLVDLQAPAALTGGWQVQLGAMPDREQAEDLKHQAMMLFPSEEVEVVWDAPNYKVRIGNRESRESAEDLKRLALRLGYSEAWVVRKKRESGGR